MGNTWRKKSTDLYIVELTTDRRFSLMTMDGTPVDGKHDTVCLVNHLNGINRYFYIFLATNSIWNSCSLERCEQ